MLWRVELNICQLEGAGWTFFLVKLKIQFANSNYKRIITLMGYIFLGTMKDIWEVRTTLNKCGCYPDVRQKCSMEGY